MQADKDNPSVWSSTITLCGW